MDITSAASLQAAESTTGSASSRFSEDYDTFLQLLTSQLQNQDPTDPMNTNEFTQQIVSYSSLEQQINTNTQLEDLVAVMTSAMTNNAVSYVGDTITYENATTDLKDGEANWTYNVDRDGVEGQLEIRNAAGVLVRKIDANTSSGRHEFNWDGRQDDGSIAPDGTYSLTAIVRDANDVAIGVDTSVSGVVEGVDLTGSEPELLVDGRTISISEVLSVRAAG